MVGVLGIPQIHSQAENPFPGFVIQTTQKFDGAEAQISEGPKEISEISEI